MTYIVKLQLEYQTLYLKGIAKDIIWTETPTSASKFTSVKAARNCINLQFPSRVEDEFIDKLEVVSLEDETKTITEHNLTREDADEICDLIREILPSLIEISEKLPQMKKAYAQERQRLDNISQDLLHKMEFAQVNVVDGYKLYKKMHDTRIDRRLVKDNYDLVSTLLEGPLMSIVFTLQKTLSDFDFKCNTRVYKPRVLCELFEDDEHCKPRAYSSLRSIVKEDLGKKSRHKDINLVEDGSDELFRDESGIEFPGKDRLDLSLKEQIEYTKEPKEDIQLIRDVESSRDEDTDKFLEKSHRSSKVVLEESNSESDELDKELMNLLRPDHRLD